MARVRINDNGYKIYTDDDHEYHRDDGPAEIRPDGSKYWYRHGIDERENGPSDFTSSGIVIWRQPSAFSGSMHREYGPAWDSPNGEKYWIHASKRKVWPEL